MPVTIRFIIPSFSGDNKSLLGVHERVEKLSYLLAAGMAAATLSGAVLAADDMSEAIAERIAPVGQVYTAKDLEGIATAAAAPAAASSVLVTARPCSRWPASPVTTPGRPVPQTG